MSNFCKLWEPINFNNVRGWGVLCDILLDDTHLGIRNLAPNPPQSHGLLSISRRKSQYPAMGNLLTFVNLCMGIPLGYHLKGNLGALIAVAVSDLPTYAVIPYGLWREKLSCFWQDIQLTALFVRVLAAIILCRYGLGGGLPLDKLSAADMISIYSLFQ